MFSGNSDDDKKYNLVIKLLLITCLKHAVNKYGLRLSLSWSCLFCSVARPLCVFYSQHSNLAFWSRIFLSGGNSYGFSDSMATNYSHV